MFDNYPNVVGAFYDQRWAMLPEALERYRLVVDRWANGVMLDKSAVEEIVAARTKPIRRVEGKVAVIPVMGVIAQRMSLMESLSSGGVSTERLGREFDGAVKDPDIDAIVLNIDSPGGSVYGVEELADKIFAARGSKQIYAIANSMAASAAYWIGSAADQFVITPSGEGGSIGVYSMHVDQSKFNEDEGIAVTYISAGKYKVEGNPHSPLEDEAREAFQQSVDRYYDTFVESVAKFRGVEVKAVRNGFGEGRVLGSKPAVAEKMFDRVITFDSLLEQLGAKPAKAKKGKSVEELKARRQARQRRFENSIALETDVVATEVDLTTTSDSA